MGSLLTWVQTEMPFSFSVSGASQEEHVLSGWCQLGELIEGECLTFGSMDSGSGLLSEPQGNNSQSLGDVEESGVVGDGANNCDNSAVEFSFSGSRSIMIGCQVLDDSGDGERVSVQS